MTQFKDNLFEIGFYLKLIWHFIEQHIKTNDYDFMWSAFMIIICPITWNLVARWEFHTKIFTRMAGDNRLAADIFAHVLIEMGILRNYLYSRALQNLPQFDIQTESTRYALTLLAYVFITYGLFLDFMSFYRLGIHGIYYADYFGILMSEKVTAFPYNFLDNPLYVGSTFLFFGTALLYKSFYGILLSCLAVFMYFLASKLENPMTELIYSESNINSVKKLSNERKRRDSLERIKIRKEFKAQEDKKNN